MTLEWDPTTGPLSVKSGPNIFLMADFYTSDSLPSGKITIELRGASDQRYYLSYCARSDQPLPVKVPAGDTTLVWTIYRTFHRVVVICDTLTLLDITLTDEMCDRLAEWGVMWGREVGKVQLTTYSSRDEGRVNNYYCLPGKWWAGEPRYTKS